ncbi:MAG: TIGR01244 family sulfur transferase [Pseudomonadota bacterium]
MKHLHENLYVSGQITPDQMPEFKNQGITLIINNRPDGEQDDQPTADNVKQAANDLGIEYQYLPMANGHPMPANLVPEFRELISQPDQKVLAHCRSGMRSSVIWALGAISAGEVNVDEAIAAAGLAGIPLQNARALLESAQPG